MKQLLIVAIILAIVLLPHPALAHTGPPYVVLPDQKLGAYNLTLWADPDIGKGTFFIEVADGDNPTPDGTMVQVRATPAAGGPEVSAQAERQSTNNGKVFRAELPFDREGEWQGKLQFAGPLGNVEIPFRVIATPAIEGWVTTIGCLLPFVLLGGLWLVGLRRQKSSQS